MHGCPYGVVVDPLPAYGHQTCRDVDIDFGDARY